jgi:hypothetical protein
MVFATAALIAGSLLSLVAQTGSPALKTALSPYEQVMNREASVFLDRRVATMGKIHTRAEFKARQQYVRSTWLHLIGGLPEAGSPLNAKIVGTVPEEGFRIERVIYDSLPGYHVTANLYMPTSGIGPYPAVIYHAGHGPFGKSEAFGLSSNLARHGIAVLAYDPLGAGERIQVMNPATGKSWAGPDEHSQAQIPISLIGDNVSRYMVWDAMRGIDYLATRTDIDAHHIGSYGCSGGGTLSAYLTALDTRVTAGVVACYITSYKELLGSIGPQDGEQVIPDFIKSGLGFPDIVELAAPRAYVMVSTTEDMFPFAGARSTHDEAAHFYALDGAAHQLEWFTGPGHHGAVRPLMPNIIAFFEHTLAGKDDPAPEMTTLPRPDPHDLQCTSTGQVLTALPGRSIYQVNRDRASAMLPKKVTVSSKGELVSLQSHLRYEIPIITGMGTAVSPLVHLSILKTEERDGYRLEIATFPSRFHMDLPVRVGIPDATGRRPALLITSEQSIDTVTAVGSEFDRAAKAGTVVLAMTPLPWPPSTDAPRPTMGTMLPWTSRAFLVGRTFVGMRTEDMLAAVRWLTSLSSVDKTSIDGRADDASAVVLLHAAVLTTSLHAITLEHALISYRSVLDAAVHRGVTESVIPGVLLHYDLDDLMIAIGDRPVTLINPVDGEDKLLSERMVRSDLARVLAAKESLGWKNQLRVEIDHEQ